MSHLKLQFTFLTVTAIIFGVYLISDTSAVAQTWSPKLKTIVFTKDARLETWDDGTAYVKGEVVGKTHGCEVDGTCSLLLNVNGQKVALVYAEGDRECRNGQAASWASRKENAEIGRMVKSYGAYREISAGVWSITFCDLNGSFILGEKDPVPVGAYTEKVFEEMARLKGEAQENEIKRGQGKWLTYEDKALGYKFSYPFPLPVQAFMGAPFTIVYDKPRVSLVLGFIAQGQLALMGIDFCQVNPGNRRCELVKIGDLAATIDWGNGDSAFIKIPIQSGIVTFTVKPNSRRCRYFLMSILHTFKLT